MLYFMLFNIKYLDIAIFWKPSIVFFVKTLACLKYLRTFAPLLTKSTSEKKFWRGGRVVDCGGLENRCAARHPRSEEHTSELQSRHIISYAVFCLKKKN